MLIRNDPELASFTNRIFSGASYYIPINSPLPSIQINKEGSMKAKIQAKAKQLSIIFFTTQYLLHT